MALAWENWVYSPCPLPRDAGLWDQQLASDQENYEALGRLRAHIRPGNEWDQYVIHGSVDLTQVGDTNILKTRPGEDDHWHVNGGAISLAELFDKFGEKYTVAELMLWYYNAPNNLRKRHHSWASKDVIAASRMRKKVYDHYGHRD